MRLTVVLGSGRGFPAQDTHAGQGIVAVATFRGQARTSSPAGGSGTCPTWDAAFGWELDARDLRSLEAGGQCKLEFARADGRKLGWVMLDLRAAKLNAKRPAYHGSWFAVAGPFRSDATPEVHILHTLTEQPAEATNNGSGAGMVAAGSRPASASQQAAGGLMSNELPVPGLQQQRSDAALAALSQGLVQDSAQRRFRLSLDLLSFSAGRRLPQNVAAVVVQLSLPAELLSLIAQGTSGRLPPRLTCLRTQPAVEVARGSEVALPGGHASCDFSAGLLTLATLLARGPVMSVDVLHRERLSEDCLLGRAHVPLAPLLQEACVEGKAGVCAMLPVPDSKPQRQERVQVGSLQLVMSLEEIEAEEASATSAGMPAPAVGVLGAAALASMHRATRQQQQQQHKQEDYQSFAPETTTSQHLHQTHPASNTNEQTPSTSAAQPTPEADVLTTVSHEQGSQHQDAQQALHRSSTAAGSTATQAHEAPADTAAPAVATADIEPAAAVLASLQTAANQGLPTAQRADKLANTAANAAAPLAPVASKSDGTTEGSRTAMSGSHTVAAQAAAVPDMAGDELEAAWELELWKRQEEARWREEMKQREAQRMAALEQAWLQRERERDAEAAALRQEYASLEARARQVLTAAEQREKAVIAAEEAVARRRRELEREHAARVADAEAAVYKLKAQCQAQLELQQQRADAAAQAAAAAEKGKAAAEARQAAADAALQAVREQHASTPLGKLEAALAGAQQTAAHAEARAAKAARGKQRYKEQVVRLAQEVAALQGQLAELVGLKRAQLQEAAAAVAAEEAALAARQQAMQLSELKQQLAAVQQGQASSSAGSVGGEQVGKENQGSGQQGQQGKGLLEEGAELARLLHEREALLDSGAYRREDALVRELDRRIRQLSLIADSSSGTAGLAF